jgi:hypothetical protein
MNPFVRFMQTPAGRGSRIVAGIALIAGGLLGVGGVAGYVMAGFGLVPLSAGVFDFCVPAPLFKVPFSGAKIRELDQGQ